MSARLPNPSTRPITEQKAGPTVRLLDEVVREHALRAIGECGGSVVLAAKALGIGKATLYRWLEEWDIDPKDLGR